MKEQSSVMQHTTAGENCGHVPPPPKGGANGQLLVDMITPDEAMERAYGILWIEPNPSQFAIDARNQLLLALNRQSKMRGVQYAIQRYGQPQIPDDL